jgi:hypothetical protein
VPNLSDWFKRGKLASEGKNPAFSIPAMFWYQESLGMAHLVWKARMLRCAENGVNEN